MKFYEGDHVIDHKGREVRLSVRIKIAGRKGWEARTVEKPARTIFELDSEIKAAKQPAGFQFLLA